MDHDLRDRWKFLKDLRTSINQALTENRLDEAKLLIDTYFSRIQDAESYIMRATYHYQKGELDETVSILQEAVERHPYNYEIRYNLGIAHETIGSYPDSILSYAHAAYRSKNEQEMNHCMVKIKELSQTYAVEHPAEANQLLQEVQKILGSNDHRAYPMSLEGSSLVRKVVHAGTDNESMANIYQNPYIGDVNANIRLHFKTEMLKGKTAQKAEIRISKPSIVPLSLIEPNSKVKLMFNGRSVSFEERPLPYNRFHYFRFDEPGVLRIKADRNVFVGRPAPIRDEPKRPRLILKIFIDGLSQKYLEDGGLSDLMPETAAFFNEGFISTRSYANSEWTLPSKASIHTGVYSTEHLLLHPKIPASFQPRHKLLAEYLSEAGYYTAWIGANWRTTPTMGYLRGIDRFLYRNLIGGSDCKDIVMETIEHLAAFRDKNNYVAISLMDLHHVADEIEEHLMAEVQTGFKYREKRGNKGVTSVQTKFDEAKVVKYGLEIKRLDHFLGILFDYVKKQYSDDEMLVVLHSDHGQTYLEDNDVLYHDSRVKIPFMIRGQGVARQQSEEWVESVDILPSILHLCGIEVPRQIDGRVPVCLGGEAERDSVLMQILHPGQTYKAVIKDAVHDFVFETEDPVLDDLTVNLSAYKTTLINRETGLDETDDNREKVCKYESRVMDLVRNFHRWGEN
jgi:tetratricopeptide (TPR) repeat protein